MGLELTPITLAEANAFVERLHRHHKPVPGCKFCVAVSDGEEVKGVVIVGRPVARMLDDGWTLEVNRCCTDGHKNACSNLLSQSGVQFHIADAADFEERVTTIRELVKGINLPENFDIEDSRASVIEQLQRDKAELVEGYQRAHHALLGLSERKPVKDLDECVIHNAALLAKHGGG